MVKNSAAVTCAFLCFLITGCVTSNQMATPNFTWEKSNFSAIAFKRPFSRGCELNFLVTNKSKTQRAFSLTATAFDQAGNTLAGGSGGTALINPYKQAKTWMRFVGATCSSIHSVQLSYR